MQPVKSRVGHLTKQRRQIAHAGPNVEGKSTAQIEQAHVGTQADGFAAPAQAVGQQRISGGIGRIGEGQVFADGLARRQPILRYKGVVTVRVGDLHFAVEVDDEFGFAFIKFSFSGSNDFARAFGNLVRIDDAAHGDDSFHEVNYHPSACTPPHGSCCLISRSWRSNWPGSPAQPLAAVLVLARSLAMK